MTTTADERAIGHLADLMHTIRPSFDIAGCVAALRKVPVNVPLAHLLIAVGRYCVDTRHTTPAMLTDLANHAWTTDGYPPCPRHPGNRSWRDTGECGQCFAERRGTRAEAHFDRRPPTEEARKVRAALKHAAPKSPAATEVAPS